ncbi:transporter substrate-binding domain-containing protein [Methylobacterium sp. J-088]|uniref:transporter substrate-binding domain-containing protein n=1 Tax=Methylobacterium sp. J-088 TaxID=2836664 RepID=UPI0028C4F078|nr:transporter substrate-binding domain-containing protein [Methylobacterium sp. J-088]
MVTDDDTPFAFTALRNGDVHAITQDGPKLVGLLAKVPDRQNYEIPPFSISNDDIGVGNPKGETRLRDLVNEILRDLEKSGEAAAIYDRWFGPDSEQPLPCLFRIGEHDRADRRRDPVRPSLAPRYLGWLLQGFEVTLTVPAAVCGSGTVLGFGA